MSEGKYLSTIYDDLEYEEKTKIISSLTILDKNIKSELMRLGFKYEPIPHFRWVKIVSKDVIIAFYYRKKMKHPYCIVVHDFNDHKKIIKFQEQTKPSTINKHLNKILEDK